jgi:hypothetical protein
MRWGRFIQVLCACILFCMAAQPVAALIDPSVMFHAGLLYDRPAYMCTAQDWAKKGDFWKERCELFSGKYDERMRAYVQQEADKTKINFDMSKLDKPTAAQRAYIMSTGFHTWDPDAAGYYDNMLVACDNAQKSYSEALQETKVDDYAMQAEILESGAGIYETLGMNNEAQQVRDAATTARAHETLSSLFLPLPGWLAIPGVLGGLFVLHRWKK